jgi:hypothetical protein
LASHYWDFSDPGLCDLSKDGKTLHIACVRPFSLSVHGGSRLVAVALTRIALVTRVQAADWLPPRFRHRSQSREYEGTGEICNQQLEPLD